MVSGLINANPVVYEKKDRRVRSAPANTDEYAVEAIDQLEIFDILHRLILRCAKRHVLAHQYYRVTCIL